MYSEEGAPGEEKEVAPLIIGNAKKSPNKHGFLEEYFAEDNYNRGNVSVYEKYLFGTQYLLSNFVCGLILVTLGVLLENLAVNNGYKSIDIGSLFLARGVGLLLGHISSPTWYKWFRGRFVLAAAFLGISFTLAQLSSSNMLGIYIAFLILGIETSLIETGSEIMILKVYGNEAVLWQAAGSLTYAFAGIIVPIVVLLLDRQDHQCYLLSFIVFIVAVIHALGPKYPGMYGSPTGDVCMKLPANYDQNMKNWYGYLIAFMGFWFIGSLVTVTVYLPTYINSVSFKDSFLSPKLLLILWLGIMIGRIIGIIDLNSVMTHAIPNHLSFILIVGLSSMLPITWFPHSEAALWIGMAIFGLCNGPCIEYAVLLYYKMGNHMETPITSFAIGLHVGSGLVPFMAAFLWSSGGGHNTLTVILFLSMLIPLIILNILKKVGNNDPFMSSSSGVSYFPISDTLEPI